MMRTVAGWARTWRYLAVALGCGGLAVAAGYLVAKGLPSPQIHLFWIAVTVLPGFLLAVWLVRRRPEHVQSRRLLIASTASAVGVGLESVIRGLYGDSDTPDGWFWLFNLAHQYCHVVGMASAGVLIASYPDGTVDQPWQRWVTRALWALLALPPLMLLTRPELLIAPYLLDQPLAAPVTSPFTVEWLTWLGWPLEAIMASYLGVVLAVTVLVVRFVKASAAQRAPMRPLVYSLAAGVLVVLATGILSCSRCRSIPAGGLR